MRVEELNITGDALNVAIELYAKFPQVNFTSGRRDVAAQARAMAQNVTLNPKWLDQTYLPSAARDACAAWVDAATRPIQFEQTEAAFVSILQAFTDEQLAHLSKHLGGHAFDVQPTEEAWGEELCAFLMGEAVKRGGRFLDHEGGLCRWHWQAR